MHAYGIAKETGKAFSVECTQEEFDAGFKTVLPGECKTCNKKTQEK